MELMKKLFMLLLLLNVLFVFFSSHPMMKGLFILIQTVNLSLLLMLFKESSWFSMILLIMFLGGMLILFIYVISLIQNNVMNTKLFLPLLILSILFVLMMKMNLNLKETSMNFFNSNMFLNMKMTEKIYELKFIFFLFSKSYYKISIFFVIYLFISMISMIKIIMNKKISNSSEMISF